MSSATSVNDALSGYLAGKVPAEKAVATVAAAYYRDGGRGKGDGLLRIVEVFERAHPGIIELSSSADRPGFVVRLADRPFPKRFERELREAVAEALHARSTLPPSPVALPGLFARVVGAIRRLFSA